MVCSPRFGGGFRHEGRLVSDKRGFLDRHRRALGRTYPRVGAFGERSIHRYSAVQVVGPLQVVQDGSEQVLVRVSAGHTEDDSTHAYSDVRPDLQQLQPYALTRCFCHTRSAKPNTSQLVENHVGKRGKPQTELIGLHGRRAGPVGEQVQLLLLDAVFHFPRAQYSFS